MGKTRKPKHKTLVREDRAKRTLQIIDALKRHYPSAQCALHYQNPFELLVATVLSAQATDESINRVSPKLFRDYPTPQDLASAPLSKLEELLKSINYYKTKAKNLKALSQKIIHDHQGNVPRTLEELTQLPGVGRKTANVVLGTAFGIASGIVVDTHVKRLSYRLGWTKNKNPIQIEKDLQKIIPQSHWISISHFLIEHGRKICQARTPKCQSCFLDPHCPKAGLSSKPC